MEIWKDIKGYEGLYQISNYGRVKSLEKDYTTKLRGKTIVIHKAENILKLLKINSGYLTILLHKNGISKRFFVHRIVAEAFILNPQNLPQVNHKDENKINNKVENLEWCDQYYNINYGNARTKMSISKTKKPNYKIRKPIVGTSKKTNEVVTFNSIKEASEKLNVPPSNISSALHGKIPSAYGYIWNFM